MPFTLDPELAAMAGPNGLGSVWDLPRGDAIALRNNINITMQMVDAAEPSSPDVNTANFTVPVEGGRIGRCVRSHGREICTEHGRSVPLRRLSSGPGVSRHYPC